MEIKDNAFNRQFESTVNGKPYVIEYSIQERKLFLTKIHQPEEIPEDDEVINDMIKQILSDAEDKRWRVMPIHPKAVTFFRKNPAFKGMLPPGIRL
jgi:hypothetical protein